MDEMMRCRLKAYPGWELQGQCVLRRSGDQLRAQAQITGIRGLVEWHLCPAGAPPVCAQASPAMGEFTCDRGIAWFCDMPEAMIFTCDGKPCLYAVPGGTVSAQSLLETFTRKETPGSQTISALLQEEPEPSVPMSAQQENPEPEEALAPEREEALPQTEAAEPVCEAAQREQAPAPCEETVQDTGYVLVSDRPLLMEEPTPPPQTCAEPAADPEAETVPEPTDCPQALPWALDEEGIACALNRGENVTPFPGVLEGARFARVELGEVLGVDHYLVGVIPLENEDCYYMVGVPGEPKGLPHQIAGDFTHYLPACDGSGYWVKYMTR